MTYRQMLCAVLVVLNAAAAADAAWPHHERLAPDVHVIGFADRYRSANCGWIETDAGVWLVDLPRGLVAAEYLDEVARIAGKPAIALLLTHATREDARLVEELRERGIKQVYLSPKTYKSLMSPPDAAPSTTPSTAPASPASGYTIVAKETALGDRQQIKFFPCDELSDFGGAVIYAPPSGALFAGPLVYHGPRVPLVGTDTAAWRARLAELAKLKPAHIVPGFGSWGHDVAITRQDRFLAELRRQVGYFIAQGRPHEDLLGAVHLAPDFLVWMPYDTPLAEDIEHVYQELTVPRAPFGSAPPQPDDKRAHALVLIGDQPHEPGHVEEGLRPVFAATGVVPHYAVDVRALSAENLARVQLLVILRDGLMRPQAAGQPDYVWMTREQEQAVVDFVQRGGGFLNLHNSMGIYPEDGPYLRLVGGRYIGHGPLERFRVEVVDRDHPVTRGVDDFSVADEQHTPPFDSARVHLLLRNRSDDGQTAAAGWVYEPGKGRLCHLANGHTREALAHPMYQRLLQNAVRWCVGGEVASSR